MDRSKPWRTSTSPQPNAKFPMLVSYALVDDPKAPSHEEFRRIIERDDVELLLDSGAFTALNAGYEIKLDRYMRFLEQWSSRLFGYLALDVLGDPEATDRNLRVMLDSGFKPIPVHVRGDDCRRMDELFEISHYVAIGGMRRPHRGPASPAYVKQKMTWARGRPVHWLGYTNAAMIRAFNPFSCDCSSWSSGVRYGNLSTYLGDGKWTNRTRGTDRAFSAEEVAAFERCGFAPSEVRELARWSCSQSDGITRREQVTCVVNVFSWISYIRWVRATIGTRVFMAVLPSESAFPVIMETLTKAQAR